jgi:LysR family transcriptional regulator, low CO2-responsive transcriptional regulator
LTRAKGKIKKIFAALNKATTMIHEQAITLKQLRALAAIVAGGNLSLAASRLNVTVPAVSTQLRNLEANLGEPLLERGPDGKTLLTAIGREVLAAAEQIDAILSSCIQKVSAISAGHEGLVFLGAVSTAKYFAPHLIAQLRRQVPRIKIEFRIGNREEIISALKSRQIELAIMGRPPREPEVDTDLLGDHPHVLIAPPKHPLVGRHDISSSDLLTNAFLVREKGSGTRALMERLFDRIGVGSDYESIEFGSNETIKQAVMAGLGIAVISAHTVQAELMGGRLAMLSFPGFPIIRQWFLVRRRDTPMTPSAKRVRDVVLALKGSFLPGALSRSG